MKNIFLFLLIFCSFLSAEDYRALEKRLAELEKRQLSIEAETDSLQKILHTQLKEKSASEQQALAGAFELTQQLKHSKEELKKVKAEQDAVKKELHSYYSSASGSLQKELEKTDSEDEKKRITAELISLMEKQWAVSPLDNPFSFKIQKIQDINLAESADSLETLILGDYLRNASLEVEQKIAALADRESEIERLLKLQNKARDFLEESSESRPWQIKSQTSRSEPLANEFYGGRDKIFSDVNSNFENTENFYLVLRQLQNINPLNKPESSSRKQLEQIQQLRKALQELEKYIQNKILTPEQKK